MGFCWFTIKSQAGLWDKISDISIFNTDFCGAVIFQGGICQTPHLWYIVYTNLWTLQISISDKDSLMKVLNEWCDIPLLQNFLS